MTLQILVVDDSRTMRDLLRIALTEVGHRVAVAEDGLHGLDLLDEVAPDVIISDINMPRLDGLGFIEAVRARGRFQATPILVLTTEGAADLKARARAAGATGWIVKPFDAAKLARAISLVAG